MTDKLEPLPRMHFTEMVYFYHYNAICFSETNRELDQVLECINSTVPEGHKDLTKLAEVGRKRREQINNQTQGAQH